MVVFNVNPHQAVDADLRAIRAAFGQTYVFHTADTNIIVLATMSATREEVPALRFRAKQLDRRFKATFSFQDVLKGLAAVRQNRRLTTGIKGFGRAALPRSALRLRSMGRWPRSGPWRASWRSR